MTLHPQSDEAAQSKWEKRKAELVEAIEQFDHELTGINSQLKTTPSHLDWDKLPETEKFQRLAPSRKQLVDTVKLIAYRAETALAAIVREELARTDDARSLLSDLFRSEADLLPDLEQRVLRVQVHPMSNPRANRAIAHLLEHLNAAEFTFSGTKMATRVLDRRRSRNPELGSTTESHRSGGLTLGRLAEEFTVEVEECRLLSFGRDDLAAKVEWVAENYGDGFGVDVLSFEENDDIEQCIPVKTTGLGKHFVCVY